MTKQKQRILAALTKKQRRTLAAIFAVLANIPWHDAVSLLIASGAELTEAKGSRVGVVLIDEHNKVHVGVLHRPHPQKELPRGMVGRLRDFLDEAGIRPPD